MHWYKDAYKKNTKQHIHGGKRERQGSLCQIDYSDEDYDSFEADSKEQTFAEDIDKELQIVSPKTRETSMIQSVGWESRLFLTKKLILVLYVCTVK